MRIAFLRYLLPSAALFLAACGGGDGSVRSPDLPPPILAGIGQVSCNFPGPDNSLAVDQTATCRVIGGCAYIRVDANGNQTQTLGVCPDDLTFTSGNPGVVSIDPVTGVATGEAPGTTTITAGSGGQVSPPTNVTVTAACGATFAVTPANAILFSGATAGTSQTFTATLTLTDGTTQNVSTSANTTWASSNEAAVTFTANQATAATSVAAETAVSVTATYNGNVCPSVTGNTLTATANISVRPAQIDGGADGICIETVPPATAFTGCREITATTPACPAPTSAIELAAGDTRQLQVRGRFTNGFECNITASSTLTTPAGNTVATVNDETAVLTGVGAGSTTVSATFDGITANRPVSVIVDQVLGNNSLAVFAKSGFNDADTISLIDAQNNKFSCVGANNLVIDGLGNRTPRGALKVFAYAATCESTALDDDGNCTALPPPNEETGEQGEASAAAFLANAVPQNVSNLPPQSVDLLDDGIVWNSVSGYWAADASTGVFSCQTEVANPSANVGDTFVDGERVLVLGEDGKPIEPPEDAGLPQGALQPNGLVYSDAAVRIGFNCVTATYSNPENPDETRTDGMTVLVLPAVNDILLSGSNDGNALCETLAPLFGSGSLLGLVEVTNVLSSVTSSLTPLLEGLDPLTDPIDDLVTVLQTDILGPITGPLIDALDEFLIDPVLEPLVCEITNVVDGLLGLLTGNPSTPQECGLLP